MKRIAILASGSGSNAENIVNYFKGREDIEISLIATNKSDAFVLERAKKVGVPSFIFTKKELNSSTILLDKLRELNIDYVVLAGFLLLVPAYIVEAYRGRIVNIHPALLPNYGGTGMYGDNVHKAVKEAAESYSGITIHNVNEQFDDGDIIFQAKCDISPEDNYQDIANKVHSLEYEHFPRVIDEHISNIVL